MSVICPDWAGRASAGAQALEFAEKLHGLRRALSAAVPVLSVGRALADQAAPAATGRPVVLLEHADRMNDSTHLLRALLEHDPGPAMVPFLLAPEAAGQAHAAGAGSRIRLSLAGKTAPETGGP